MNRFGRPRVVRAHPPADVGPALPPEDAQVVHPEDELVDLFDNDAPLSRWTIRVAELLRLPGVADRWRHRCRESLTESRQRVQRHNEWAEGRAEYLTWEGRSKVPGDTPPETGWVLERVTIPSPEGLDSAHIEAWVPPEYALGRQPFAGGPLPFSSRHPLSIADCYFVLALVHNNERRAGRIEAFLSEDQVGLRFYFAQLTHITRFSPSDRLMLDDCLERVHADVLAGALTSLPEHDTTAGVTCSPQSVAVQSPTSATSRVAHDPNRAVTAPQPLLAPGGVSGDKQEGIDSQVGSGIPPVLHELLAAAHTAALIGTEARVVKVIAEKGGKVKLPDADTLCLGNALSAFKRAKPKLKKSGWCLYQRDNHLCAKPLPEKVRK